MPRCAQTFSTTLIAPSLSRTISTERSPTTVRLKSPGFERLVLRQHGDAVGHRPDQLGDVGRLARRAANGERDARVARMADVLRAVDRADRRRARERLAEFPRPALVARLELQVAACHVE